MLTVRPLWATTDRDYEYGDIFTSRATAEAEAKRLGVRVLSGWGVFDTETNMMPDEAKDIHWYLEDALAELKRLQNERENQSNEECTIARIPVQFEGVVSLEVPSKVDPKSYREIALALVIATCQNLDIPIDEIEEHVQNLSDEELEKMFESARVCGSWS